MKIQLNPINTNETEMNLLELKERIRTFIATDQLTDAINLLKKHAQENTKLDELIMQEGRYTRVKKQARNGTASNVEVNRELNALSSNVLAIIRDENLVLKPETSETEQETIKNFKEKLAVSVTRFKVSEVLIKNYVVNQGLTISQTVEQAKLKSRKLVVDYLNDLNAVNLIKKRKEGKSTLWQLNDSGKDLLSNIVDV